MTLRELRQRAGLSQEALARLLALLQHRFIDLRRAGFSLRDRRCWPWRARWACDRRRLISENCAQPPSRATLERLPTSTRRRVLERKKERESGRD